MIDISRLAALALTLALVAPAQAERIEWTETEQRRTKTIYSESGDIVYQAHWDKNTGALTGAPFDIRARHREPPPKAKPEGAGVRFETRAGQLVLTADSLVRVKFLNRLHSGRNRTGDRFSYEVIDPVKFEGKVLLASGTKGNGTILRARRRGLFGKSGRLQLDFGEVKLTTGKNVRLVVSKASDEANERTLVAAGTSAGGALLLGPIGLAGGVFMKGRDVNIPKGSISFLAVKSDVLIN
jgi:hypothetical protein